jgi:hypothetical protein
MPGRTSAADPLREAMLTLSRHPSLEARPLEQAAMDLLNPLRAAGLPQERIARLRYLLCAADVRDRLRHVQTEVVSESVDRAQRYVVISAAVL